MVHGIVERLNPPSHEIQSAKLGVTKPETTTLSLLTRDGAVAVTFLGKLSSAQYAHLFEWTRHAETKLAMESVLRSAGAEWGIQVVIDDV